MTIDQIHKEVSAAKRVSRRQVIRYMNVCGIKPMGARQRPQLYPDDAPLKIKVHLGFERPQKIDSLSQLRDLRKRATQANGKGRK